jgi:thiol-disulfide isomerase/thioredoxin/uncharacterized membrane protein YphA (DoxX/SURF4 family)
VSTVLLTSRCLLAAVFLLAAVGKLLDLAGSRRALEEFGVPSRLASLGGPALPIAELSVAIALLIRPSARWGAGAALLLLLVFVGGVANAMARGRAPDCHCFGQIHSEPAGRSTLIRNLVLAAPAVLVIAAGTGPSINGALSGLNGTQVALVATSVLATALALVVAQLWGDRRRLRRELAAAIAAKAPPGLPRGTPAPDFALTPIRGGVGSLAELDVSARPTVLVFVSTSCGPCLQLFPFLARWQESLLDSLNLVAIFEGESAAIERVSDEQGLSLALAQEKDEAFHLYALRATPSAVQITADGMIAGPPTEGAPAIEALIRSVLAQAQPAKLLIQRG